MKPSEIPAEGDARICSLFVTKPWTFLVLGGCSEWSGKREVRRSWQCIVEACWSPVWYLHFLHRIVNCKCWICNGYVALRNQFCQERVNNWWLLTFRLLILIEFGNSHSFMRAERRRLKLGFQKNNPCIQGSLPSKPEAVGCHRFAGAKALFAVHHQP